MSKFSEKVRRGELPNGDDWLEHLKEAHESAPSMTPDAFAKYQTAAGKNSYQLLADAVLSFQRPHATLVDLACGDGHLISYLLPKLRPDGKIIGIDMSSSELDRAEHSTHDARVAFYLSEAARLPLEDKSVDEVLCHMTFMLMMPVEPVVHELRRVLKPAGRFSAVIASPVASGLFLEIQKLRADFVNSRYPKAKELKTGDPRLASIEGITQIFSAGNGFAPLTELHDFHLAMRMLPEGIWELMKNMYLVGILSESEKMELKQEMIQLGRTHSDASGKVLVNFPMRIFTVLKVD